MKVIDISIPITEKTIVWENEFSPQIKEYESISNGSTSNTSLIKMSLHTATHIDFPRHFFDDGKTLEDFELERFYGRVYVAEIDDDPVTDKSFEKADIPEGTKKILIKTGNSELYKLGKFSKDFVALKNSGADWLIKRGIELVGIDYLSIEKYENESYPVHRRLLKNDVLIVEGLNLENVSEGEYILFSLPLKVFSKDAAPVRAFLLEL